MPDTLLILERMIEMAKLRNECCLIMAFIDMEKAYDIVHIRKLLEVMIG